MVFDDNVGNQITIMDKIYIHSVNKYITIDELKGYEQKVGHAYKITNAYFQKCVGYDEYGKPIVESICVLNNVNGGDYQLIINATDVPKPSLDFVNGIMDGSIVEMSTELYDSIAAKIKETAEMLSGLSMELGTK